jgi:hypothetical protein
MLLLLERVEYIDVNDVESSISGELPPPLDDAIPVEHQSNDLCFEITWDRYNVYQSRYAPKRNRRRTKRRRSGAKW